VSDHGFFRGILFEKYPDVKKILILLAVSVVSGFLILQVVFYYSPKSCWPTRDRVTIATIGNGIFMEYIPQTGIVKRDSVTDSLFVEAEIDQIYLSRMFSGLKATSTFDNREYHLIVSKVLPTITKGRFTITLTADSLKNLESKSIRLRIELGQPKDALLLAVGGFYKDSGGKWVFVVEGDKAMKRIVKLGRKNTENFEVLAGLKAGEKVITSSYENFAERDSILLSEISSD
jgi:hypothetical protein